MITSEVVKNRIISLCKERGITLNKLATISGLTQSTLDSIINGKSHSPKVKTVKILCDGLGITLGEFFSTEEFDNLEQEIK